MPEPSYKKYWCTEDDASLHTHLLHPHLLHPHPLHPHPLHPHPLQRGSRCIGDQDTTRIKMQWGSRCIFSTFLSFLMKWRGMKRRVSSHQLNAGFAQLYYGLVYSVRSTPRCIFQKCTVARCRLVWCGLCILAPVLSRHDSSFCIPAPVLSGQDSFFYLKPNL